MKHHTNLSLFPLIAIACFLMQCVTSSAQQHRCIHDEVAMKNIPDVHMSHSAKRGLTYETMRVTMDMSHLSDPATTCLSASGTVHLYDGSTYSCTADDVLSSDKILLINRLANATKEIFEKVFLFQRLDYYSFPSFTSCGDSYNTVPSTYKSPTISSDYVFFITARPVTTAGVLGFASACYSDSGRPVMGYLNLNPSQLDSDPGRWRYMLGLSTHECLHALGFSSSNFKKSTNTRNGRTIPTLSGTDYPKVIQHVKDHFDCNSSTYIPLEDGGGSGTMGSHWEKSIFMNEIMTGSASRQPALSVFTLAYFEDSNWYKVDYNYAEGLQFGYHKSCSFLTDGCRSAAWKSEYGCSKNGAQSCNPDRSAIGSCALSSAPGDPTGYGDGSNYGIDNLADYCPFYVGVGDGYCASSKDSLSLYGEVYGVDSSKCFDSTLLKLSPVGFIPSQRCYDTYCLSETKLKVKVGRYWTLCDGSSSAEVPEFGGELDCPSVETICHGRNQSADAFPEIISFSPGSGSAGDTITIYGKNFEPGAIAEIIEGCTTTTYISPNSLSCVLPTINFFDGLGQLIADSDVNVIVTNPSFGYMDIKFKKFNFKVSAGEVWNAFVSWSKANVFVVTVIVAFSIQFVGLGAFAVFRCCRSQSKKTGPR